ncbi:hypothetical protein [Streptomyces sp. NPDC058583]|uniref:hypothetical protein n=1 Tax=unclassified Streptomyces TaxID=2593676 RepID=UPI003658FAC9
MREGRTPHVTATAWRPQRGDLAYDTGSSRVGVVTALPEDTDTAAYQLTPEGGGTGWTAPHSRLRPPDVIQTAVLYVCVQRGELHPVLPVERAQEEGRNFADLYGLHVVETITDPFGEPDPQHREGWRRVRELAAAGRVATVIVRWPAAISPEHSHELRAHEIAWLKDHATKVRYSWPPPAPLEPKRSRGARHDPVGHRAGGLGGPRVP